MDINSNKTILFLINSGLGDICHAMPIFFVLRDKYPHVHIECVFSTESAKMLVNLFFKNIDGVVVRELNTTYKKIHQLIKWRFNKYNYVISGAHFDTRKTALISYLINGDKSIGLKRERLSFMYDMSIDVNNIKNVYAQLAVLFAEVGITTKDIKKGESLFYNELKIIGNGHETSLLQNNNKSIRIALINGADDKVRGKWDPHLKRLSNIALNKIIEKIRETTPAEFIILGSEEDTFPDSVTASPYIQDLRGKTKIKDLIIILCRVDLLIGNDSGILHLAHYCKTPYLGIYGPTSAEVFQPDAAGLNSIQMSCNCAQCMPNPTCGEEYCELLKDIPINQIILRINNILHN